MKPIIINMNEMSDSREVYESKPNPMLPVFLYTCLALFVAAILWMCLGKLDIVVKANGMVRPNGVVSSVLNTTGGAVASVHVEDGATVEEGTLLYVMEHEGLLAQKDFYEEKVAFYKECVESDIGVAYIEALQEAQFRLNEIERSIDACYVKAPCAGVVNMVQEPVEGTWLNAGVEVCSILPAEESGYKCLIYVDNADVGKLEPGMQVKFNVYSYPNTEYGYVYGTLTKIAKDIRIDSGSGKAYYLAEATMNAESFVDGNGVQIALKAGMVCEAKIVTGEENIMRYALRKLNLLVGR